MEELRSSVGIIAYCWNKIPAGEIKTPGIKLNPPKTLAKNSMESTIQHFKVLSAGLLLPVGEVYSAVEAPKGEFGVYIASLGKLYPGRVKLRAPGFFHLQGTKPLVYQHLLAYVVTVIGTMDIVFG